ncbi:conserved hypothetical protein [Ricinus communis]|uniref:Uncharacterized protein n=1 Tax=Ricinus communis TaxID=3988 RepID=B9SFH2_RICCO|nr:conserved hypothetical protein [Ricinus communis]
MAGGGGGTGQSFNRKPQASKLLKEVSGNLQRTSVSGIEPWREFDPANNSVEALTVEDLAIRCSQKGLNPQIDCRKAN